MTQYYRHSDPFPLELGGELPELTIAYHTYGTLNSSHDNVVWVCHALHRQQRRGRLVATHS